MALRNHTLESYIISYSEYAYKSYTGVGSEASIILAAVKFGSSSMLEHVNSMTPSTNKKNQGALGFYTTSAEAKWITSLSASKWPLNLLGFSDFAKCLDIIEACSSIMLLASTS